VIRGVWTVGLAAWVLLGQPGARGDEVRYYEQNGVTYCETLRVVGPSAVAPGRGPVSISPRVCREQLTPGTQEAPRASWTLVTEYRLEPYWVNRWNPFAEPYLEYRCVPHSRWERRTEVVPSLCRRSVPQPNAAEPRWEVVSRIAVAGAEAHRMAASGPFVPVASPSWPPSGQWGGVARVANEPPRSSERPAW